MRKTSLLKVLIMLLISVSVLKLQGQTTSAEVEFLNAPVLFKEGNKSYQQVVASYGAEKEGKIV